MALNIESISKNLMNLKNIVIFTVGILAGCLGAISTVEKMIDDLMEEIYTKDTKDFYYFVGWEILKQQEKMSKDPDDVRTTDMEKLTYFCEGYFGQVYAPQQTNYIQIKAACKSITDRHINNFYNQVN